MAIDALKSLCTHPRTSVCEAIVFEVLSKVIILSDKLFHLEITEEPVNKLIDSYLYNHKVKSNNNFVLRMS